MSLWQQLNSSVRKYFKDTGQEFNNQKRGEKWLEYNLFGIFLVKKTFLVLPFKLNV